jgi:N-acetylmuramoyl-L-alanine amidase
MFDFNDPVVVKHNILKDKHQLQLHFPGMTLKTFAPNNVLPKFVKLKEMGLISNIEITEKGGQNPRVLLAIEFAPYRTIKNNKTEEEEQIKNIVLIKWNTIESPHRLILDIFLKEDLDQITKKDAVLLHASNNTQQYDVQVAPHGATTHTNGPRIVIDPGHGGSDMGAKGFFGLVEKDLTLDIAQRVHKLLHNNGYKSLLTRSEDKEIPLVKRAHLAHQLKADLLVSIHVNSSGMMGTEAQGLETFYLLASDRLPQQGKTGFLFINCEKDINVVKQLNKYLIDTMNHSKMLAHYIQKSVLTTMHQKHMNICNRGIKPEKFRVFLQTEVPAALVEVGFITNKQEAERLNKVNYRNLIANGIYQGICNYINAQTK